MTKDDLHFRLRIPEELKRRIEAAAQQSRRSMTAEMVDRLQRSFDNAGLSDAQVSDLDRMISERIAKIMSAPPVSYSETDARPANREKGND